MEEDSGVLEQIKALCRTQWRYLFTCLAVAGLVLACEAPLDMQAVEEQRKTPIRKLDAFQDVLTTTQGHAIFVGGSGVVVEFLPPDRTQGLEEVREIVRAQIGEIGQWPNLISITQCADQSIFALGLDGSLWVRKQLGQWVDMKIDTQETVQDLTCAQNNQLWVAAGFGTLLHSLDGGQNWQRFSLEDDLFLTHIDFPNDNIGYAIGEFGTVLKSTDAGKSWSNLRSTADDFYPLALYFLDTKMGWVAGLDGEIFITRDGAQNWHKQETATHAPIYKIRKIGEHIFAVGNYGTILEYNGRRWQSADHIQLGSSGYLRALAGDKDSLFIGGQALAKRIHLSSSLSAANMAKNN
ncbi:MAG: YCF48-related protein [Alphaproteobacteria bacterium]|nr:YCF48-related protein [Alphaproteobacteria bacterium]